MMIIESSSLAVERPQGVLFQKEMVCLYDQKTMPCAAKASYTT